MTDYSRIYYEAYAVANGEAVGHPTGFASARSLADGLPIEGAVRFHHAERLTALADDTGDADFMGIDADPGPAFFDDEISRAIRTTEVVPALAKPDLHNEIAEEGCDRCFCGCKYWEHDRCIDCGTHVSHVKGSA